MFFFFKGAEIFLSLEYDREMERRDEKIERAKEVDDATNYLSNAIWWYIKDTDTYNYSRPQFEDVVEERLTDYIEFVVNATKEVSYDGTVEGWDTAWTFPNALLFTISIMTVIGELGVRLLYMISDLNSLITVGNGLGPLKT